MFEITLLITSIETYFPIGRLDKASEGLIFMTNDGDIVNKILVPETIMKRIYGKAGARKRKYAIITTTFFK
jgi:16S rRNA U516 pseudouridylate synthase RsuA-like enzyme